MKRILCILFLFLLTLVGSGQLVFDSDFENGRLDTVYIDSNEYVLSPVTNLHCRITNATSEDPVFKIFDSVGYQLRSYHNMVYRYTGETIWSFFDTTYKTGTTAYYHFSNNSPFTQDTVYIGYWFPYTYGNLKEYLNSIHESRFIRHSGVKGTTIQGRNLYGYEITDTSYADCYKSHVVVVARQHPIESINGYFIEGFTNYLLYAGDSVADFLRRNHRFFIYPMLNPDGVVNGSGQNSLGQGLNREWENGLLPGGTPEIDTIRPVIWDETDHRVDWFIDIHSNPGSNIKYYWWGYTDVSPVPQWQISKASQYVLRVAESDASWWGESFFQDNIQGNGVNDSKTAANWFTNTFNAISFTFEPTSEPLGYLGNNRIPVSRLKEAGASLAKGFLTLFDTALAMGGTISHDENILVATITGGYPPYIYAWDGPVSGNTDTLTNITPGFYSLEVTDSLGCMWSSNITIQPNAVWNDGRIGEKLLIYPNPSEQIMRVETTDHAIIIEAMLFNSMGEIVLVEEDVHSDFYHLNLSTIRPGIYFIRVTGEGFTRIMKLIR